MADQLERNFWKSGKTPLSATNLNLMTNAIIDNAEAIEKLGQTVVNLKPKVYTFNNIYSFPPVGETFVSKTDDRGNEVGSPLYLDLSTNKLYKWEGSYYTPFENAIQIISCGGA